MPHVRRRRRGAHPRETSLAVVTIAGGLTAFITSLTGGAHFLAVCLGIVVFFFGFYSQLVSVTTAERWLNVIGIGLAFVAAALGLSQGGFRI